MSYLIAVIHAAEPVQMTELPAKNVIRIHQLARNVFCLQSRDAANGYKMLLEKSKFRDLPYYVFEQGGWAGKAESEDIGTMLNDGYNDGIQPLSVDYPRK